MNDDLLIKFIDGKTTPEETELVLKELSQDGDASKEWLQIVQGARLADSKPIVNIEPDDFVVKTLAKSPTVQSEHKKVIRLPFFVSGIIAVAASVAIIATVMVNQMNQMNQKLPKDTVADVFDTMVVVPVHDSTVIEDVMDIKKEAQQAVADAIVPNVDKKTDSVEPVEEQMKEEPQSQEQSVELVGHKILQDSKTATASKIDVSSFEMIKPSKSPYRVRVQNPEKEFVFEWKISNASNVRLLITDNEKRTIIEEDMILGSSYGIVASYLVDKGELDWTIEVTFDDGAKQTKAGKIELVSVKQM